jgi:hypothetical protein
MIGETFPLGVWWLAFLDIAVSGASQRLPELHEPSPSTECNAGLQKISALGRGG